MFSFARKFVDKLEGHTPKGNNSSDETYFNGVSHINNHGYALRVLHVQPHSAAYHAGLEAWFDYIVRINNHELPMKYPVTLTPTYAINDDGSISYGGRSNDPRSGEVDYDSLAQELATVASGANKTVTLDVWNAKGGVLRQVAISVDQYIYTPHKLSEVVSELFHDKFKQIGATVQSQHTKTATYVWHVLNTHPNSPAFQAQLVPYSDYVIGCDSAFATDDKGKGLLAKGGETLFSKTILGYYNHHYARLGEDNIPITLYVYNHDYDILRPVTVHLSKSWAAGGNRGILGCDVGYGLLHRVPEVIGKFDSSLEKLNDLLFENMADYSYKFSEKSLTAQSPVPTVPTVPTAQSPPKVPSNPIGMVPFNPEEPLIPPATPSLPAVTTSLPAVTLSFPAATPSLPAATASSPAGISSPISSPIPANRAGVQAPPPPLTSSNLPTRSAIGGVTLSQPAVTPQAGVAPSIAPPKFHRKKKQHASNGISSLTDFMNEELTKSKNSDVKYASGGDNSNTPPPPPPPKSAR